MSAGSRGRQRAICGYTETVTDPTNHDNEPSFQEEVAGETRTGLASEFLGYMREYAKWWLTPIIIVFLGVAALLVFGGSTGTLPFIYALF